MKIYDDKHAEILAGKNGQGRGYNQLYYPQGVFVDKKQIVYICDSFNNRVLKK